MKNYRLRKDAMPFFKAKHATSIMPLDEWEALQVDTSALELIEAVRVDYGHERGNATDLCGWSAPDHKDHGTTFRFTINFPSVKWQEHDKFSNGRMVRELMDKIQGEVNDFYERFVNDEIGKI